MTTKYDIESKVMIPGVVKSIKIIDDKIVYDVKLQRNENDAVLSFEESHLIAGNSSGVASKSNYKESKLNG